MRCLIENYKKGKKKHERIIFTTIRGNTGPIRTGGGVNTDLLRRIQSLEVELQSLKEQVATEEQFGLSKISRSESVTEASSGLVLGAREKNSAVPGTLAAKIKQTKDDFLSFRPSDIAGLSDYDDSNSANIILYKYSDTNWAGIGCRPDGAPILRAGFGHYDFGWDGVYLNGVKITK